MPARSSRFAALAPAVTVLPLTTIEPSPLLAPVPSGILISMPKRPVLVIVLFWITFAPAPEVSWMKAMPESPVFWTVLPVTVTPEAVPSCSSMPQHPVRSCTWLLVIAMCVFWPSQITMPRPSVWLTSLLSIVTLSMAAPADTKLPPRPPVQLATMVFLMAVSLLLSAP